MNILSRNPLPTSPAVTDADPVRTARRELKRAERSLSRTRPGTPLAGLAVERLEAATLRFISLTGHNACRGRYLETAEEHEAHTAH